MLHCTIEYRTFVDCNRLHLSAICYLITLVETENVQFSATLSCIMYFDLCWSAIVVRLWTSFIKQRDHEIFKRAVEDSRNVYMRMKMEVDAIFRSENFQIVSGGTAEE